MPTPRSHVAIWKNYLSADATWAWERGAKGTDLSVGASSRAAAAVVPGTAADRWYIWDHNLGFWLICGVVASRSNSVPVVTCG